MSQKNPRTTRRPNLRSVSEHGLDRAAQPSMDSQTRMNECRLAGALYFSDKNRDPFKGLVAGTEVLFSVVVHALLYHEARPAAVFVRWCGCFACVECVRSMRRQPRTVHNQDSLRWVKRERLLRQQSMHRRQRTGLRREILSADRYDS